MKLPNILNLFVKNRSLIYRMTYKELTDRYAGSSFGLFWALVYPLILVSLYALVFTFVFKVKIAENSPPLEYALYAIIGLVAWISMQEGLSRATNSLLSNTTLIKQVVFPIEILPVINVLISFLTLLIGFIFYLGLTSIFLPQKLNWFDLLLPAVILVHLLFAIGVGWILAAVAVFFRDLKEIVTIFLFVGMFITPILFSENTIPSAFYWPIQINPATHLINMYRDVLFSGQIIHPWSFLIFPLLSIFLFFFAFGFFKKMKSLFANLI